MKRCLRFFFRILGICFALLFLLILVEVIVGWRCNVQAEIPSPVLQPKERLAAISGIKDYVRPEDDAYLSLPEWYIVWSYQEKADFQKDTLPSEFPYFGAVEQYWETYCCIARLIHGKYGFNAGEQVMLVVIGTSFSAEYILTGLYEKSLGRLAEWTSDHQPTEEDFYAYRVAREYADFVHVRPFYEFSFARHVKGLWAENPLLGRHVLRKWERRAFLSVEYAIEALYCWGIEKATHLSYGYEPDRTYAWLDHVDDSVLKQISLVKAVKQVGPGAYIVDAPRYQAFTDVATALVQRGVHFVEIAGNSSITISVIAPDSWPGEGCLTQRLFSLPFLTRRGWRRVMLRCDVSALDRGLAELAAEGIAVEHIYDY